MKNLLVEHWCVARLIARLHQASRTLPPKLEATHKEVLEKLAEINTLRARNENEVDKLMAALIRRLSSDHNRRTMARIVADAKPLPPKTDE